MIKEIPVNNLNFLFLKIFLVPEGGRGIVLLSICIHDTTTGM